MSLNKNIVFLLTLAVLSACSSGSKNLTTTDIRYPSSRIFVSDTPIDNSPSRQIFFVISAPHQCIQLSIQCTAADDTILKKEHPVKLFIITEKAIFVPTLKSISYIELGRNFTYEWEQKDQLKICTDASSPFMKLEPGIYRIRMTSFSPALFTAGIKIDTLNIKFFQTYTDAEQYLSTTKAQNDTTR